MVSKANYKKEGERGVNYKVRDREFILGKEGKKPGKLRCFCDFAHRSLARFLILPFRFSLLEVVNNSLSKPIF